MNFSDYDAAARQADDRVDQLRRDGPLDTQLPASPTNRPFGVWICTVLWTFWIAASVIGLVLLAVMKWQGIPERVSPAARLAVAAANPFDYLEGICSISVAAAALVKLFQLKKAAYRLFVAEFILAILGNLRLGAMIGFGAASSRALYSELFVLFTIFYVRNLKQKAILE